MKKRMMFVAVSAMMLSSLMMACNEQESAYPGYEKTQDGLYYRFYTQNEGELPQLYDVLETSVTCVVNDTNVIIPVMDNLFQLIEPRYAGDIFSGMAMMHKGDSASFIVNIDSTFRTFFGQPTMPSQFLPTDVMRFEIKMKDFCSEKEFAHRQAAEIKGQMTERIEQMKANNPEETEKAAQTLDAFLKKNKIDVQPTESGLYYVMTEAGDGQKPEVGQLVKVHYTGKLLDGTVFDSSVERGEPIQFPLGLGRVIAGWDEGIALMSKGEKGVLYIPYYLAYGDRGAGGDIKPFDNLMFEVELVDFEDVKHE
jgi:FKBP-type peptidyl-prolyl cis-trans isomerase